MKSKNKKKVVIISLIGVLIIAAFLATHPFYMFPTYHVTATGHTQRSFTHGGENPTTFQLTVGSEHQLLKDVRFSVTSDLSGYTFEHTCLKDALYYHDAKTIDTMCKNAGYACYAYYSCGSSTMPMGDNYYYEDLCYHEGRGSYTATCWRSTPIYSDYFTCSIGNTEIFRTTPQGQTIGTDGNTINLASLINSQILYYVENPQAGTSGNWYEINIPVTCTSEKTIGSWEFGYAPSIYEVYADPCENADYNQTHPSCSPTPSPINQTIISCVYCNGSTYDYTGTSCPDLNCPAPPPSQNATCSYCNGSTYQVEGAFCPTLNCPIIPPSQPQQPATFWQGVTQFFNNIIAFFSRLFGG